MNFLILDDEPCLRDVYSSLISQDAPDSTIVSCGTLQDAITQTNLHDFHIALIDYNLPDGFGTDLIPHLPYTCIKLGMSGNTLPLEICHKFEHFFLKPFIFQNLRPFIIKATNEN
jgi:CheY-like chemotaxis protein